MQASDVVISTKSGRWTPPYEIVRVAQVTDEGFALTFRELDGTHERERYSMETVFLFKPASDDALRKAAKAARHAKNIIALQDVLMQFRDEAWYKEHPDG